MSDKSIRRAVWSRLAPMFALSAMFSFRGMDAATAQLDENKKARFRNNWSQKVDERAKRVARWRKRNRIAAKSRAINRGR